MKWLVVLTMLASFNTSTKVTYNGLLEQCFDKYSYKCNIISFKVFDRLDYLEGEGDTLTGIPTGKYGVTQTARLAVDKHGMLADMDVSMLYLNKLYGKWEGIDGFSESPIGLKEALLDLSYNVGESAFGYKGITQSLSEGNYKQAAINTLDTANSGGDLVLGLAKRRAIYFNVYAGESYIHEVVQDNNSISYLGYDGGIIFKYKGNKHELSNEGSVDIMPHSSLWM